MLKASLSAPVLSAQYRPQHFRTRLVHADEATVSVSDDSALSTSLVVDPSFPFRLTKRFFSLVQDNIILTDLHSLPTTERAWSLSSFILPRTFRELFFFAVGSDIILPENTRRSDTQPFVCIGQRVLAQVGVGSLTKFNSTASGGTVWPTTGPRACHRPPRPRPRGLCLRHRCHLPRRLERRRAHLAVNQEQARAPGNVLRCTVISSSHGVRIKVPV